MIITPLGVAVEPEVYWRNASVPFVAPGSIHRPANWSTSESSSVQSNSTPSSGGTPATHRAKSLAWEELVRTAQGLASTTMDRSRVIGRLSLGR